MFYAWLDTPEDKWIEYNDNYEIDFSNMRENFRDKNFELFIGEDEIGRGAANPAFFIEFIPIAELAAISPLALFFSGEKIEKNLESWKKIFKSLGQIFNRNSKYGALCVDPSSAFALVFNEVAKKYDINEIKILGIVRVNRMWGLVEFFDEFDSGKLSMPPEYLRQEVERSRFSDTVDLKNQTWESELIFYVKVNGARLLSISVNNSQSIEILSDTECAMIG